MLRSGGQAELLALAERLDAPVVTTFMGKGAIDESHPLAVGSGCDEAAVLELLAGADVVLCVGTELGADTTAQYELRFSGRLIHLDAAPERIGVSYPALALVGDAQATLRALGTALPAPPTATVGGATAPSAWRACANGSPRVWQPSLATASRRCWRRSRTRCPPMRSPPGT